MTNLRTIKLYIYIYIYIFICCRVPEIKLENAKGLSDSQLTDLMNKLNEQAKNFLGEVSILIMVVDRISILINN